MTNTIDRLRELEKKISPGEWRADPSAYFCNVRKTTELNHNWSALSGIEKYIPSTEERYYENYYLAWESAELIALMRNNLSKILALVEAVEEICKLEPWHGSELIDIAEAIDRGKEALEALRGKDE